MKTLIDFFALRPVFTLYGLKIIWFVFLLNFAIQVFTLTVGTFAAYERWDAGLWLNFSPYFLSTLVNIALVRVLLEVAATILLRREPTKTSFDSN